VTPADIAPNVAPQAPEASTEVSADDTATPAAPAKRAEEPEVTPADIAPNVAPQAPEASTEVPAESADAPTAPAKKAAPGDKLPARKQTPAE
jgi:hypothetical protein